MQQMHGIKRKRSLLAEEMRGGRMDRRWCTSHTKDGGGRRLLGLTFNMEERKRRRRKRWSENIHRYSHTDACWDGMTC